MTLEPPRFPGCTVICPAANLPAFATKRQMRAFKVKNSPGTVIIAAWLCNACGLLHYWGTGADPSGQSSGTTRTSKHIEEVKSKFMASETAKTVKAWI